MTHDHAVQDHYPADFAHCFGCGRLNEHGHHIRTFQDGDVAVATFTPRPFHMALPGFVYGGLIASLIDCHCIGAAAIAAMRAAGHEVGVDPSPRFVTAALRVDYLKPTPLGVELEVRARVKEGGGRKYVLEATVSAGGTVTARGEVVAVAMPETMATRGK
jgi:acyl-coenzyme A thioesterase PaaI-like protein